MNGLANTLVYALQSRHVRGATLRHAHAIAFAANRDPDCGSFHVGLGNVDVTHIEVQSSAKTNSESSHTDIVCGSCAQDVLSGPGQSISEWSERSAENILFGCFDDK